MYRVVGRATDSQTTVNVWVDSVHLYIPWWRVEPAKASDDADGIIAGQEPPPILIRVRVPAYWDDVIQPNAMCRGRAREQYE